MSPSILNDWLVPFSTFIGIWAVAVGVLIAVHEYKLKVRAERRLSESAQAENEIKLLKLFTELMDIAHARAGYTVSEHAIEFLLRDPATQAKLQAGARLADVLADGATLVTPVGGAAQDAAIASIASLGERHAAVRGAAIQALQSISAFKPAVACPQLAKLQASPAPRLGA